MSDKPRILIISPASSKANNGNWHTASRWQSFLSGRFEPVVSTGWNGEPDADLMIALHARRSWPSIEAWTMRKPEAPLVLALTGTDLYRDIEQDHHAQQALQLASRLVLLQPAGRSRLAPPLRAKARVIFQSAPAVPAPPKSSDGFTVIMVGHLRAEKMPQTYMQAARLLGSSKLRLLHVGGALEPALEQEAKSTALACERYRWLGPLAHEETRALLAASDLMVIASRMEGGANVIVEAVTSDVPVLASDIDGNRGMLGEDYEGYFPLGDAAALAQMIERVRLEPAFRTRLQAQCRRRAPLFAPAREQADLIDLMDNVLESSSRPTPDECS